MEKKIFSGLFDDNKTPIYIGDKLKSKWGYEVIVTLDTVSGKIYGKLVCDDSHSCKDIPYALNNGEGYTIVK